jgi:diadenosine tetraphosphate (Ap4A) HIT family hydrolase
LNYKAIHILVLVFLFASLNVVAQADACIFCRIAAGKEDQSKTIIYIDHSVVAFMSHGPRNSGHVLVIPVMHAKLLTQLPDSVARELMSIARKIALAIKTTDIKAEGFNFQINSGEAAGQEVFHVHMHVIPRFVGELAPKKTIVGVENLEPIAAKIRQALNE